jgi:hypothetical protein
MQAHDMQARLWQAMQNCVVTQTSIALRSRLIPVDQAIVQKTRELQLLQREKERLVHMAHIEQQAALQQALQQLSTKPGC